MLWFLISLGLTLKEENSSQEDAAPTCSICNKSVVNFLTYICTSHEDCRSFYLHKTCSESPIAVDYHQHILILKDYVIIGEHGTCHVCNRSVIGSCTYTCRGLANIDCQSLYLHKSCAELPKQINLSLLPRPCGFYCDIFRGSVKVSYACIDCEFDVCAFCAFEQRVLHHQGHKVHTLTLMKKTVLFECDTCNKTAEDSSYVCTTCDFWIHMSCAFPPSHSCLLYS